MRVFFQIALLILYIAVSDSSIYTDVAGTLSQYLRTSLKNIKATFQDEASPGAKFKVKHNNQPNDLSYQPNQNHRSPSKVIVGGDRHTHDSSPKTIIRIFKTDGELQGPDKPYPRNGQYVKAPTNAMMPKISKSHSNLGRAKDERYRLDAVLNSIRRTENLARRAGDSTTSDSESSSLELREWKNDWKELWVKKKMEALNQSSPQGDVVNMVAARPWGVPCGDPNQHDMPWGTCMMAMECEPEYRIYRGDFQCGRTKFVCCSIQLTNYDMYQGFDVSFDESGLSSDSDEKRSRGKENRHKKKERERKRNRKARVKRKKKIKKNIKKIIREIRKILNKQYRNGTSQRKRKTKQLKKFIKDLKKKYRQDRKSVKNIHEIELVKIDSKLSKKIKEIKELNVNFVRNATFRDIIVNGSMNRKGARMLVEAYPELMPYFTDSTRRRSDGKGQETPKDYDVEYGMLYY